MTTTARTLAHLRRMGYIAEVVERWIPGANIHRDFLGVGDVLAVLPGLPVLLVQSTSAANASARINKALAEPRLRVWLRAGGAFTVHGWAGPKLREIPLTLADAQDVPVVHRPKRRKGKRRELELFDDANARPTPRNAPAGRQTKAAGIVDMSNDRD